MFDNITEKRGKVLSMALFLENLTSYFLSKLLGIENSCDSISFGNKSTSLSFNSKVNLLIDMGALENLQKRKFLVFMEIRNQFAHNIEAKDYESCYKLLNGRDKFILKEYPQNETLEREQQLENATLDLCVELAEVTIRILEKIKLKVQQEVKLDMYDKMFPVLLDTIERLSKNRH